MAFDSAYLWCYDIEKATDEGITREQQELMRKWESQILSITLEEMAHLETAVIKLKKSITGSRYDRPT